MNVIIFTLIAFVIIYLLLRLIARAPTKKISKAFRILIFLGSLILAILLAFGGRFLFSLPLILLSLGIIKLKGQLEEKMMWARLNRVKGNEDAADKALAEAEELLALIKKKENNPK